MVSKALVEEYVNYRKEKRDATAFKRSAGRGQKKLHSKSSISLEQIEVEDQLQYDRLKSEMTNLKNLQNQDYPE